MYKNILITGDSGCGKSTLINEILHKINRKYSGFRTLKYYINGVDRGFYLHGYVEVLNNYSPISVKIGDKNCFTITETFEKIGTKILRKSRECSDTDIILLDEIGVLEDKAEGFKREIISTLEHEKMVLGVIKKKETDFLNSILERKDTLIIDIEKYSKDELNSLVSRVTSIIDKK